jgi:hypothetical protein
MSSYYGSKQAGKSTYKAVENYPAGRPFIENSLIHMAIIAADDRSLLGQYTYALFVSYSKKVYKFRQLTTLKADA